MNRLNRCEIQSVAQQPIQVQAAPAQGYMPINIVDTQWVTGIFVIFGLVFWAIMGSMADDPGERF